MEILLIVAVVVIIIIVVAYHNKEKENVFKVIIDNRVRILNESVKIIESSKNIETIVRRKDVALEHLNWFIEIEDEGITGIIRPSAEYGKEQMLLTFNANLFNQLEILIEKQIQRFHALKTKQAKGNAQTKAIDLIRDTTKHFDKTIINFNEINSEIKKLLKKVEKLSNYDF